jgi:type IV pilus assembly protein PilW
MLRNITKKSSRGFTIIELMVGIAVGLIGIMAIMQVYMVSEGQKRTTTGVSDAQESGMMGLFMIERDLRMAGLGSALFFNCSTVKAYNGTFYTFSGYPVTITQNSPVSQTDRVEILYSTSAYGGIDTTLSATMPNSSSITKVSNGIDFKQGDLFIVTETGLPCTVFQSSQDGQKTGQNWDLQHNPGGCCPHNSAGGDIYAQAPAMPGGYSTSAKVINMGTLARHAYYISNNNLVMEDLEQAASATNPVVIANDIIAMRVQYGRDTNADGFADTWDNTAPTSATQVVAVRIGLIARGREYDKANPTTALTPALWNGGPTVALSTIVGADAAKYRYKIFETTVPLRNVLWNN